MEASVIAIKRTDKRKKQPRKAKSRLVGKADTGVRLNYRIREMGKTGPHPKSGPSTNSG